MNSYSREDMHCRTFESKLNSKQMFYPAKGSNGAFMLVSDHIDFVRVLMLKLDAAEHLAKRAEYQANKQVEAMQKDNVPSMYAVMNGEIPLEMYSTKGLAEAALRVLRFKTNLSLLSIKPFWG